jgi:hypothetical protein
VLAPTAATSVSLAPPVLPTALATAPAPASTAPVATAPAVTAPAPAAVAPVDTSMVTVPAASGAAPAVPAGGQLVAASGAAPVIPANGAPAVATGAAAVAAQGVAPGVAAGPGSPTPTGSEPAVATAPVAGVAMDSGAGASLLIPVTENQASPLPGPVPPVLAPLPGGGNASGGSAAGADLGVTAGGHLRERSMVESDEDSLLTDQFLKQHFHRESMWVASKASLDIGAGGSPNSAQMKNRLTADKIVLYCARKANSGDSGSNRPLLWDWRWCESEESAAYNRLVAGNEFRSAGRAVLLGCAGVESYVYFERCLQTLLESAMTTATRGQ